MPARKSFPVPTPPAALVIALLMLVHLGRSAELPTADRVGPVPGQPLFANVTRLLEALDFLGAPPPAGVKVALIEAAQQRDAMRIQQVLDAETLFMVELNPESR